jgi:hypothetical protein
MKRLIFLFLLFLPLLGQSQGFLHKVTPLTIKDRGIKAETKGTWLFRYNMGMTASTIRLKFNDANKFSGFYAPEGLSSKLVAGVFYTKFKPDATAIWAAGAMITIPVINEDRYGIAIAGSYSIFKVGIGYDFGLPFKTGLYFMPGITIDIFNLN